MYNIGDLIRLKSVEAFYQKTDMNADDRYDYSVVVDGNEDLLFKIEDLITSDDGVIYYGIYIDDSDIYYIDDTFIEEKVE
jgi:uncharacterized protein (UPF0218 family)